MQVMPQYETANDLIDMILEERVAMLALSGMRVSDIAKKLNAERSVNLTTRKVAIILHSDACKKVINEIRKQEYAEGRAVIQKGAAELAEMTVAVLKKHLKDNNLNAVPMVFKALAITGDEDSRPQGDNSIQVYLPGAMPTSTVVEVVPRDHKPLIEIDSK